MIDEEELLDEESVRDSFDDVQTEGDVTLWKTMIKAWSNENEWCDTTMAMQLPNGVLIRTQYITDDGDGNAEALQFIPGVKLEKDENDLWVIK